MKKPKEPKYFLVFRLLGILFIIGAITLMVLGENEVTGDFMLDNEIFAGGMFAAFLGLVFTIAGWIPKFIKMGAKTQEYFEKLDEYNNQHKPKNFGNSTTCNNCGATVNFDGESGVCPYCNTAVNPKDN